MERQTKKTIGRNFSMKKNYVKPEATITGASMNLEVMAHSWNPGGGNYPDHPWDPHGPKPHHIKERDEWEIFGE